MVKHLGRKKHKSKRLTIHTKLKIRKKSLEKDRKLRKAARQRSRALGGKKILKKDPGIPNLFPFKEKLLRKAMKKRDEEERMREEMKQRRKEMRAAKKGKTVADVVAEASARQAEHEVKETMRQQDEAAAGNKREMDVARRTRRQFFSQLKSVCNQADVIIEVLDARDPLGCRARAVEAAILGKDPSKRIILLLNKIDLIPLAITEKWLAYLRHEFPCVAFKASTQQQRSKFSRRKGRATKVSQKDLAGSGCVGADTLLQLLKNYCRNRGIKTAITVGVIGYPNVGKSSVINSLKRSKAASVSAQPGHTKKLQEVTIDSNVKLLDCPGIIFDDKTDQTSQDGLLLRNCLRADEMTDPVRSVEAMLRRVGPRKFHEIYQLEHFSSSEEFLRLMAAKKGKLRKGGAIDINATAHSILQDWNAGKIPFFTDPPAREVHAEEKGSATIVADWGKEFEFEDIADSEKNAISGVMRVSNDVSDFVQLEDNSMQLEDNTSSMQIEDEDDDPDL